ncbi:hypothetical protein EDD15DRAFT_144494 [Pisolithus albus]|nr:hypothetical protein EDD15DRAFT_144494 [Pisolithus albus]
MSPTRQRTKVALSSRFPLFLRLLSCAHSIMLAASPLLQAPCNKEASATGPKMPTSAPFPTHCYTQAKFLVSLPRGNLWEAKVLSASVHLPAIFVVTRIMFPVTVRLCM